MSENTSQITWQAPLPEDARLFERLEPIIRDAKRVSDHAWELASLLKEKKLPGACLESVWALGWIDLASGPRAEYPTKSEGQLDLLWNAFSTLISAQFSGFSLGNRRAKQAIRKVLEKVQNENRSEGFWGLKAPGGKEAVFRFARAFSLLSLYSIVIPRAGERGDSVEAAVQAHCREQLGEIVGMLKLEDGRFRDRLWKVTLLKMMRKLLKIMKPPEKNEAQEINRQKIAADENDLSPHSARLFATLGDQNDELRNLMALGLQYENLSPFEIAEILHVVAGRYLNPRLQIEPSHILLYQQAVHYLLKKRPQQGGWEVEHFSRDEDPKSREHISKDLDDPLRRRYSPLAFVLDLPNSVLMHCLSSLMETAADVLDVLKRELNTYIVKPLWDKKMAPAVVEAIYNGMMIGAAVEDRLKDLLSDTELKQLGAETPTEIVGWKSAPDSLGFKSNLEEGVINLWAQRSEERPGAILVFGPPGTGKTTIAKALLAELNKTLNGPDEEWRFLSLSPADFARNGADQVIASAEEIFRKLQRVRRCVVLLDEMEEFLRARGSEESRESRLITTAFLPLLQETVNKREIILIVATNFVGNIDVAVTRRGRFDLILPLGPPDKDKRLEIIAERAEKNGQSLDPEQVKIVAEYTKGYTRDEIRDFVDQLRDDLREQNSKSRLADEDLQTALWRIRQEHVPMALSGKPGCSWRTFRDEATRLKRGAPLAIESTEGDVYWNEPHMPLQTHPHQGRIKNKASAGVRKREIVGLRQ